MVAEIAPGIGVNGSRAGYLKKAAECDAPSLETPISVPESNAKKMALTFMFKGTPGKDLVVERTTRPRQQTGDILGRVTGTGQFERATFCIPEGMKGDAFRIRAKIFATSGDPARCALPDLGEFTIDDFALVADPKCSDVLYVADPGFENTSNAKVWESSTAGEASADLTTTDVHGGLAAAELKVFASCRTASYSTLVSVPRAANNAGPAVKFWVRGNLGASYELAPTLNYNEAFLSKVTAVGPTWTQRTLCLPPKQATAVSTLSLSLQPGTCNRMDSATVAIDDLELTTDPSCPAQ
jgi:hypothetical protein